MGQKQKQKTKRTKKNPPKTKPVIVEKDFEESGLIKPAEKSKVVSALLKHHCSPDGGADDCV